MAMALVSYDLSSESEGEDLFKSQLHLNKKQSRIKEKVKIPIPSLANFDQDGSEEPLTKNVKISEQGNNLVQLLPPVASSPLTAKSFVPNILKKRTLTVSNSVTNNLCKKQSKIKKIRTKEVTSESDSDSDQEHFKVSETFNDELWKKVCGRSKQNQSTIASNPVELNEINTKPSINIAPEADKPYDGLSNDAFRELMGTLKRPIGKIKLMDLAEENVLADSELWLTKSLTDPEMAAPKGPIEEPVDPTRRKKHHITYLAQLAKEKEDEYKAAWATSKNNRLMSRAKYGF